MRHSFIINAYLAAIYLLLIVLLAQKQHVSSAVTQIQLLLLILVNAIRITFPSWQLTSIRRNCAYFAVKDLDNIVKNVIKINVSNATIIESIILKLLHVNVLRVIRLIKIQMNA